MDTPVERLALSDAVAWVDGEDAVYVTRLDRRPVLMLEGPAVDLFHCARQTSASPSRLVDEVLRDIPDAPPEAADSLRAVIDALSDAGILTTAGQVRIP